MSAINKLPETTQEIRNCCADLKVLGRKDFKLLLKWRLRVRDIFQFPSTKSASEHAVDEEVVESGPMDEELKIQQELQDMKDRDNSKKKRERRRGNEKKQKEIVRMQLHMMAPTEIGMEEQGIREEGGMFKLKTIDQTDALHRLSKGKMVMLSGAEARRSEDASNNMPGGVEDDTDEEEDQLERELDHMYDSYRERRAETDAKYRAKRARMEHHDEEWEGVSGSSEAANSDVENLEEDSSEDDSGHEHGHVMPTSLIRDLDSCSETTGGLSKRARNFFSQDIFQNIPGLLDADPGDREKQKKGVEAREANSEARQQEILSDDDDIPSIAMQKEQHMRTEETANPEKNTGFEVVKRNASEDDWETENKSDGHGRPGKLRISLLQSQHCSKAD